MKRYLPVSFLAASCSLFLQAACAAPAAGQDASGMSQLLSSGCDTAEVPAPAAPDAGGTVRRECVEVPSAGCYYSGAPAGEAVPLLIYFRGWVSGTNYPCGGLSGGHISGRADILRSARAALDFYKLRELADGKRIAVLVTGSSDITFGRAEVEKLQAGLGVAFRSVSVAAHSGGYVGLRASVDSFDRLEKIILLDNFYSDFSGQVRAGIAAGAACSGFYTPHNAARYNQYFSGLGCKAEARAEAGDHEYYVPASLLGAY